MKADINGAGRVDVRNAESFSCRVQTEENLRKREVYRSFEIALHGKPRSKPPVAKKIDGKKQASFIAMRLGKPIKGYANWSLRLLAERAVELGLTYSISHETVRTTFKKKA